MYSLGEDRYDKLFPGAKDNEKLTWKKYKEATFKNLKSSQNKGDGSWAGAQVGPVFATAIYCSILQLDKGTLPLYQR
jgi:hypothetical protein